MDSYTKRMLIWKHNADHGSCVFFCKRIYSIITSSTATPRAVELAKQISPLLAELATELYTNRRNTDNTITKVTHKRNHNS